MLHLTCEEFLTQLSTKQPVPGGGGASALCGALGVARTLLYQGHHRQPLYETRDGHILQKGGESFVNEYNRKLCHLYGGFLTKEGARLATSRKQAAEAYYQALMEEIEFGREGLNRLELEN